MSTYNLLGNALPPAAVGGNNLPQNRLNTSSSHHSNTDHAIATTDVRQVSNVNVVNSANSVSTVEHAQPSSETNEKAEVKNQIEELQQFNQNIDRSLQFKVDDELGVTIVRVVDKETDELIRQFPPEELINLSRRLKELNEQNLTKSGVLLEERV